LRFFAELSKRATCLRPTGAPAYGDIAREFFRPEFFNRLDGVVTFQPLHSETIHAIARKELTELAQREGVGRAGLRLRWSDRLVCLLAREGFDIRYGARPLQRVIERRVVAPLARFLIARPELRDSELLIDCNDRGEIDLSETRL